MTIDWSIKRNSKDPTLFHRAIQDINIDLNGAIYIMFDNSNRYIILVKLMKENYTRLDYI